MYQVMKCVTLLDPFHVVEDDVIEVEKSKAVTPRRFHYKSISYESGSHCVTDSLEI